MPQFSKTLDPKFIAALRLSLDAGDITRKDIIDWADNLIAEDWTEQLVFDISESASAVPEELRYILNCYIGNVLYERGGRITRIWLAGLYRVFIRGGISEKELARVLNKGYWGSPNFEFPDVDGHFCFILAELFDWSYLVERRAVSTGLNEKEVILLVQDFINVYKDYRLDNFEKWEKIDKVVDKKLEAFQARYDILYRNSPIRHSSSGYSVKSSGWRLYYTLLTESQMRNAQAIQLLAVVIAVTLASAIIGFLIIRPK